MPFNRWAILIVMSAALVAAAACGGGGGPLPTPGITTIAKTGVTANVTPFPTPAITGNQIDSSASKGYSATFPEGWNVRVNLIQTADASADVIFEPLTAGATVQANIAINCIVARSPSQEEHITFEATKTARIGLNKDIVTTQRQVNGIDATVLTYRYVSQSEAAPQLDKQDVLFSAGKCDWILTMTAPSGTRARYQPLFDAFLDSFRVS
jgi:hypothetical protein